MPPVSVNQARVLLGIGCFVLVLVVLAMLAFMPDLRSDELFRMIAQAVVTQGFFGMVVAFWFTGPSDRREEP
jgi:flagellar motor component MotA